MKHKRDADWADRAKTAPNQEVSDWVGLSQSLLNALREGGSGDAYWGQLADLDLQASPHCLRDDDHKLAFWINVYNAGNLYWMRRAPSLGARERARHFFARRIVVAGQRLSLNMIEHGILRRGQVWWARGYLRAPLRWAWLRSMQVAQLDPRIHFALNCGANGCPLIRFYSAQGIEAELERATSAFMMTEVEALPAGGGIILQVSAIFKMYWGDFGGRPGLLRWLSRYRPDLPSTDLCLRFAVYDWTINLDRFA